MLFKNFLHKSFLGLFILFNIHLLSAQQLPLFTHYYWNEQNYNPAYIGSKEIFHAQVLNRLQWVGMNGAPNTFNAAIHTPLSKDNIALGVNFYNDRIGILSNNGISVQYAYRLKFKDKYTLSLGIQAGAEFRHFQSSKINTDDGIPDHLNINNFEKSWMPHIGTGVYFYGQNFSIGLGIPQLLPKGVFKDEKWGIQPAIQYFISGAYQWNIQDNFRLLPTTTIRVLPSQPLQAEFSVNAILYDQFMVGTGVRTDKTTSFLVQYMPTFDHGEKKLNIGYSYDLSWKALRTANSGSHELMISFGMQVFKPSNIIYKSPRYF
ncbi:MAG: PorP/SprF family type IX secretion system membrane protein [Chitinophagales bacterium]|nr:PorP/SprF family type IX secretion system membrane protein [Chitinophagales bacterium]